MIRSVRVDPGSLTICSEGTTQRLAPKTMTLLTLLAGQPQALIERDTLIATIWGREAFISDEALTLLVSRLRKALGDSSASPRFIETVPQVGYRLLPQIEAPVAAPNAGRTKPHDSELTTRRMRSRWSWLAALSAMMVLLVCARMAQVEPRAGSVTDAEIDRQPLVVLGSFENLTGNQHLASAFEDAVRSGAERVGDVDFLAHGATVSSLQRMRLPPDTRLTRTVGVEVGRRERAAVLVLGKAIELAETTVLGAEIIDIEGDRRVWSDRIKIHRGDRLADRIEELAARLNCGLEEVLAAVELPAQLPRVTARDSRAIAAFSRARHALFVAGDYELAEQLLSLALEIDPEFQLAKVMMTQVRRHLDGSSVSDADLAASLGDGFPSANVYEGLYAAAWSATTRRDLEQATVQWTALTEMFPHDGPAHYNQAMAYHEFQNRPEEAYRSLLEATRLGSENDDTKSVQPLAVHTLGRLEGRLGRYRAGLARVRQARRLGLDRQDDLEFELLLAAGEHRELERRWDRRSDGTLGNQYLDPQAWGSWVRVLFLAERGRLVEAGQQLEAWLQSSKLSPWERRWFRLQSLLIKSRIQRDPSLCRAVADLVNQITTSKPVRLGSEPRSLLLAGLMQSRLGCPGEARRTLGILSRIESELPAAAHSATRLLLQAETLAAAGELDDGLVATHASLRTQSSYQGLAALAERLRDLDRGGEAVEIDRQLVERRSQVYFECILGNSCPEQLANLLAHLEARQRLELRRVIRPFVPDLGRRQADA